MKTLTNLFLILVGMTFVQCTKPVFESTIAPGISVEKEPVFFSTSIQGSAYTWNFGDIYNPDSNISEEQSPMHIYTQPGFYTVTVEVNTTGGIVSDELTIHVKEDEE